MKTDLILHLIGEVLASPLMARKALALAVCDLAADSSWQPLRIWLSTDIREY